MDHEENSTIAALRQFMATLEPIAAELDEDADRLAASYADFQAAGLNAFGSARMPLDAAGMIRALAALAETSGAFAFLALQQFVANLSYPDNGETVWPRLGVAFGHLRNLNAPAPLWKEGRVNGPVPWLTGAGLFDTVLLGVRDEEGREVFAWVEAADREAFRHSSPMALVACSSTRTVSVQITDLPLDASRIVRVVPRGTQAEQDAEGVLFQTPLMLGCLAASLQLIQAAPRIEAAVRRRCAAAVTALIEEVFDALATGAHSERGPLLRARAGDLSVRLARLAAMACGGPSLQRTHPAQRLYREALVYSLMAQTDAIANQAFVPVFP